MTTLVTGATGFIGQAVVRELRARGRAVRAFVRQPTAPPHDAGVELVRGDLRGSPLAPAVHGVRSVIHLAASVQGDDDEKFSTIAVGTERLLAALEGSAVRRLVLVSSMAVYDWSKAGAAVTEDAPLLDPDTTLDAYAAAKVWSERLARRAAERAAWDLTIVRPGMVWDFGNQEFGRVGLELGPVGLVVGPRRTPPLIHRDDCAALIVRACEHPAAAGRTYNAVDPRPVSAWRYARRCPRAGRVLVPLPYPTVLRAARGLERAVERALHGPIRLPAAIAPDQLQARLSPTPLVGERAIRELGWAPAAPGLR
jgi:nucleoside-diphosphate-sugar epimerase